MIDPRAWYPPLDSLYARREPVPIDRVLFQGDIFRDIPCPRYPVRDEEVDPIGPKARRGHVMVLGHPCEVSPGEKGDERPWRLVCPVVGDRDRRISLDGEGHWYAFALPDLADRDDLWYADFRFLATIHAEHLNPAKRVATLSEIGWHALQRRLIHFLSCVAVDWQDLEFVGEGLHPDASGEAATD